MQQPNVILIMTDQQRYDTISALGFPYMKTPNLDRLAYEGTCFEKCFCAAPSCVPSRASFFNCRYPHETNVYNNQGHWKTSWVEAFNAAGYECINVGKMHTVPLDAKCGFHQRYIVEDKDRPGKAYLDEWDKLFLWNRIEKPGRLTYNRDESYMNRLGAYEWPLEETQYSDIFVGRMACSILDWYEGEKPLFLQIGFPGPHPPYDPPQRYIDLYDGVELPLPAVTDAEMNGQPSVQEMFRVEMMTNFHDAVRWKKHPTTDELYRLRKYYAAQVTLIDEQIGVILDKCEERGLLDNAIVIFTSDHGDCLGDHGLIEKWTMYDQVMHVPAIFYSKNGLIPCGRKIDALVQQMDIALAICELAGVDGGESSAISALPLIRGEKADIRENVYAEQARNTFFKKYPFCRMIRTKNYKLVSYSGADEGELYDLVKDPDEKKNCYEDGFYADIRRDLSQKLHEFCSLS